MNLSDLKLSNADSFEEAMKKLENTVLLLEKGNRTLDETLFLYEEGIRLYRYCNNKLDSTEQKISMMLNEQEVSFCSDRVHDFEGE